jgi:hypothetical protein
VHCLDPVAGISPPNLSRRVIYANDDKAGDLTGGITMLATKLSKRPEIDIKLYYLHLEGKGPKMFRGHVGCQFFRQLWSEPVALHRPCD